MDFEMTQDWDTAKSKTEMILAFLSNVSDTNYRSSELQKLSAPSFGKRTFIAKNLQAYV